MTGCYHKPCVIYIACGPVLKSAGLSIEAETMTILGFCVFTQDVFESPVRKIFVLYSYALNHFKNQ